MRIHPLLLHRIALALLTSALLLVAFGYRSLWREVTRLRHKNEAQRFSIHRLSAENADLKAETGLKYDSYGSHLIPRVVNLEVLNSSIDFREPDGTPIPNGPVFRGIIRNPSSYSLHDAEVRFEFLDDTGNVIATGMSDIGKMENGFHGSPRNFEIEVPQDTLRPVQGWRIIHAQGIPETE